MAEYPTSAQEGDAPNRVTVQRPSGKVTFLYGHHFGPENGSHIPTDTTAVCLETASDNWVRNPLRTLFVAKVFPQFAGVFPEIERRRLPVYLTDPAVRGAIPVGLAEASLVAAEAILGMRLAKKAYKTIKEKEGRVSRRDMLSMSTRTFGALWLMLPGFSSIARLASTATETAYNATAATLRFSHRLHPEQFLCTATIRNVVIAHKQEWLMEYLGGNPHLTTIIGAAHADIESCLASKPERRLAFLGRIMPLAGPLIIPETFYSLAMCYPDKNGGWKEGEKYEVPELKALIQS